MEQRISELEEQVKQLYQQGRYQDAVNLARQALDLSRQHFGEEHPGTATCLSNLAELYQAQGEYPQAEPLHRHALAIREQHLGPDHPITAGSLHNLADLYRSRGLSDEAEPLYQRALAICEQSLGPNHLDTARCLNSLALLHDEQGLSARAEPLYQQALAICEQSLGPDHPNTAIILNNLAVLYQKRRAYPQAETLYQRVLAIREQSLGPDHPDTVIILYNLADIYVVQAAYTKAEPLHQKALTIRERVLGPNHLDTAKSLKNLAMLYNGQGAYMRAEPLIQRALSIYEQSLGPDHPETAGILVNLAVLYCEQGVYAQAEPLLLRALDIHERKLDPDHPDIANSFYALGALYRLKGAYAQAEPLLLRALDIHERKLGPDQPETTIILNNLAHLYSTQGAYRKAEPLYQRALVVREQRFGPDHPATATCLSNLGNLYRKLAVYGKAEEFHQRALEIRERVLGSNHPDTANSLNNLAVLYKEMGVHDQAKSLLHRALDIDERNSGPNHPSTAQCLDNLAGLYNLEKAYEQAEEFHQRALEIRERVLGSNHPDTAQSLNNLAVVYREQGAYAQAEPLFQRAQAIFEQRFGLKHPALAPILQNLASIHYEQGAEKQAESFQQRALAICEQGLGPNHPDTAHNLNLLAALSVTMGRASEAFEFMQRATAINDHTLGQVFALSSESRRMAYLKTLRIYFDRFMSLVSQTELSTKPEAVQTALSLVLRRKAIDLEALAAQRNAVLSGQYPELAPQFQRLEGWREDIALKTLSSPGPEGLTEHQRTLAEWTTQKEALEKELAEQIPEMPLERTLRNVDHQAVARALPPGVTLLELVRFNVYNFKGIRANGDSYWLPARYLAFVLSGEESDNVHMVDLGEARPIDTLIDEFRKELERAMRIRSPGFIAEEEPTVAPPVVDPPHGTRFSLPPNPTTPVSTPEVDRTQELKKGLELRTKLFDPLVPFLGESTQLFIAPHEELTQVAFQVLPLADGRLLRDTYRISYLSTGRDVLRLGVSSGRTANDSIVIADPDFDLRLPTCASSSAKSSDDPPETSSSPDSGARAARHSRDLNRDLPFTRLPGAWNEGLQVTAKLRTAKLKVRLRLGKAALKGPIREAIASPLILHIATHGHFLPNQPYDPNKERAPGEGASARFTGPGMENPMLRAWLPLAGVNSWIAHKPVPAGVENGLFTAEEISGLILLDTEVVVVSACGSGLGEARRGEGVFGLRRAFVLAGAKTLIMSLWSVPDIATAILMGCFYDKLLAGERRDVSLHKAQDHVRTLTIGAMRSQWLTPDAIKRVADKNNTMREELQRLALEPDHDQPFAHPAFWGAFICQGDIAELPSKFTTKEKVS